MTELAAPFWHGVLLLFAQGLAPIDTADAPAAALSAAACVTCHADQGHDWAASRHAAAWTNGLFQAEYQRTPRAWCRNCHAPLAAQQAALAAGDATLAAEGVSCAVCHVRGRHIVAGARRAGSPHDTRVVDGFGGAAFCAGCHQFNFPHLDPDGEVVGYGAEPMQDTVAQFAAGPHAQAPGACRSCHTAGRAGHRYPGAHDGDMLARGLRFAVCRSGPARIVLEVENAGAGHHVPTGDVHRHVVARAWRSTAPARLYQAFIGRRFAPADGGGKRTVWDSTLAPGQRRRFDVDVAALADPDGAGPPDEPINVELRYVYTAEEHPRHDPGEPTFRVIDARRVRVADLAACGAP